MLRISKEVRMKVDTTRFGTVEIEDSSIIRMPKGPIGFDEYTDYCLMQHRPDTSLRWLQSTQESSLAFVVIDPSQFVPDYEIELPDAEAETLHLDSADDVLVLGIVTIGCGGRELSINLAAPVVINSREMTALQVVLQDNRYSVKHPLVVNTDCNQSETSEEKITAKAA
jgi:flagellar assembly factor FliW